eukprot:2565322-Rhodomonas_salina.4
MTVVAQSPHRLGVNARLSATVDARSSRICRVKVANGRCSINTQTLSQVLTTVAAQPALRDRLVVRLSLTVAAKSTRIVRASSNLQTSTRVAAGRNLKLVLPRE